MADYPYQEPRIWYKPPTYLPADGDNVWVRVIDQPQLPLLLLYDSANLKFYSAHAPFYFYYYEIQQWSLNYIFP